MRTIHASLQEAEDTIGKPAADLIPDDRAKAMVASVSQEGARRRGTALVERTIGASRWHSPPNPFPVLISATSAPSACAVKLRRASSNAARPRSVRAVTV